LSTVGSEAAICSGSISQSLLHLQVRPLEGANHSSH
jgi:hypothetical protein